MFLLYLYVFFERPGVPYLGIITKSLTIAHEEIGLSQGHATFEQLDNIQNIIWEFRMNQLHVTEL